jgi:hypothetical protein
MSAVGEKRRFGTAAWILLAVSVMLSGICGYLLVQYRGVVHVQQNTPAAKAANLTNELSKTIQLPQVSISTVVDSTKFNDPFLATEARNGDQLLLYGNARRVILYRPRTQKVIDMFHVTTDPPKKIE